MLRRDLVFYTKQLKERFAWMCWVGLRELTRKEAVRMKRSLVAFREGLEGLLALVTALGRLGLIRLPAGEWTASNGKMNDTG